MRNTSSALSLLLVAVFGLFMAGCVTLPSSINQQLSKYEQSDDPKALNAWLFRDGRYDAAELEALVDWSISNRWQFIKFVDHLKGSKRERFLASFPSVLGNSPSTERFRSEFETSPSRTIKQILQLASES